MATRGPFYKNPEVVGHYFMYETGVEGQPLVKCLRPGSSTHGTGKPGDPDNAVCPPSGTGGNFVGVLFSEVVDVDEARFCHAAQNHKRSSTLCRPVNVICDGQISTDQVEAADTPVWGDAAHWSANGLFTTTTTSARAGTFRGSKDADGFVVIDLEDKG